MKVAVLEDKKNNRYCVCLLKTDNGINYYYQLKRFYWLESTNDALKLATKFAIELSDFTGYEYDSKAELLSENEVNVITNEW